MRRSRDFSHITAALDAARRRDEVLDQLLPRITDPGACRVCGSRFPVASLARECEDRNLSTQIDDAYQGDGYRLTSGSLR